MWPDSSCSKIHGGLSPRDIGSVFDTNPSFFPAQFEDPVVSRKIHRSCRFLSFIVCCLLSLTAVLELQVHGQQASDERATGFNRAAETLVAPGYQPQTPARINMALMDDTKPRLHRLAPAKCQDANCNEPACPGCQQPLTFQQNDNMQSAQNWQSTVINVPFDDMAEAIAMQLSNPKLSPSQRANILRSAFNTVAQHTRLDARLELDRTQQQYEEKLARMQAEWTAYSYRTSDMGNIRKWMETLYSNQALQMAQLQQMALDNAALKKSLQTVQQQMGMGTASRKNQPEPMTGMPNAQPMLSQPPTMTNEKTFTSFPYSGDGNAVMVWNPAQGYRLKPFHRQDPVRVPRQNEVIQADYQMQMDREIEALHQQMERLTLQIEGFQARRKQLPPTPDPLQPVYAPEQELKPLGSDREKRLRGLPR